MLPADFDNLWNYDQPDATELQFRAIFAAAPGYDDARLQLLTQIARAQGLQSKFDEAYRTLDLVNAHLDEATPVAAIRYYLERGRVFNSAGDPDLARSLFEQALERAQAASLDGYVVDALHMLAIVAPPEQALDWNLKALALAERSDDPGARRWFGSLYNNLGWTYADRYDYEQALEYFQKAAAWYAAAGKESELQIARCAVARALRGLHRIDDALAILRDLEPGGDGYVYEELAECLLMIADQSAARPYFERAYQALARDIWLAAHQPERLTRLQALSSHL